MVMLSVVTHPFATLTAFGRTTYGRTMCTSCCIDKDFRTSSLLLPQAVSAFEMDTSSRIVAVVDDEVVAYYPRTRRTVRFSTLC